jgi:hypothetical protein
MRRLNLQEVVFAIDCFIQRCRMTFLFLGRVRAPTTNPQNASCTSNTEDTSDTPDAQNASCTSNTEDAARAANTQNAACTKEAQQAEDASNTEPAFV